MLPQSSRPHHGKYRADIDGLRAIAVLFVLGFHAFPAWFPGGFCGVDVFFVISGFLISGILFAEFEENRFRYSGFYKRRIKRIFPALVTVLFACLAMGWFLLFDGEYAALGREVVHGAIFLSNFLLWQQSGYFDRAAATKPLLHLWSLGVEEQFYLVWPPLLALARRFRNNFLKFTVAIALLSFASNLVYLHLHSPGAYYSPLSRFWELMIGGCLAYQQRHRSSTRTAEWQSFLGLLLLAVGFFVINESREFPGWWALFPTVGTYLIIAAGKEAWLNRRFLSHPVLVWFGLISFPLYLWHWPLLSFAHILAGAQPSAAIRAIALLLSVALAWLTYRWVEQPVRQSQREKVWLPSLGWGLGVAAFAGLFVLHVGIHSRAVVRPVNELLESAQAGGDLGNMEAGCGAHDAAVERQFGICLKDKRGAASVALLGDSKAQSLFGGLVRESDAHTRLVVIAGRGPNGDSPLPVISDNPIYRGYQHSIRSASDVIAGNPQVRAVVITAATRALFGLKNERSIEDLPASPYFDAAFEGLDNVITKFIRAGKKVVLTVDNPTLPDPMSCVPRLTGSALLDRVFQTRERKNCTIAYQRQLELSRKYRDLLQKLQLAHPNELRVFDPTDLLCDTARNRCSFERDAHLLYSYTDHVSDYAAGVIGKQLIPLVKAFALSPK